MSGQRETPPIHSGAATAVAELLASSRLMALGVNRPDGWPQVTTVGYVADGLRLYFVIARDSQKFLNLQADPRASAAIRPEGAEGNTVGVSLAGQVEEVLDPAEVERLNRMVFERYPEGRAFGPSGTAVAVMRLTPQIIAPVAVIDGRSRAQTYRIGEGVEPVRNPGAGVGVSALF